MWLSTGRPQASQVPSSCPYAAARYSLREVMDMGYNLNDFLGAGFSAAEFRPSTWALPWHN